MANQSGFRGAKSALAGASGFDCQATLALWNNIGPPTYAR